MPEFKLPLCNPFMKVGSNILVAYASQTGQAKSIASLLYESLKAKGLTVRLSCLSQSGKKFHIEKESCVLFVVSTTGDGDPPDTGHLFFTQLKRKAIAKERLEFLNYALLGLGDSNYNTFCGSPKRLESLLLKLGARSFFPTAFCDDAVGTDTVAEPWMADIANCLESQVDAVPSVEKRFDNLTLESSEPQAKGPPNDEHCSPGFSCRIVPPIYDDIAHISDSDSSPSEARSFYTFEDCHCRWPFPSVVYSDTLRGVDDLKVLSLDQLTPWLASAVTHEDFEGDCERAIYPGQAGPLFQATILQNKQITFPEDEKKKFILQLDLQASGNLQGLPCAYQPGDSLCFICPNSTVEVNWLLYRLNLGVVADKVCRLSLLPNSARRVSKLPSHLPERSSLRYLFTHCLDIRQCPSRLMLRLFADHCESYEEKRRLLELCSSEGQQEYQKFIRQSALSLLDVLHAFRTCIPPIDRLLGSSRVDVFIHPCRIHLELLGSSPLVNESVGDFVYTLQELSASEGRFFYRQGVATGYLCQLKPGDQVTTFLKEAGTFRLPGNLHTPIVMIGPGTGVAPYVGFLRHIREELEEFHRDGILSHLVVAFSKEEPRCYIQDNLRAYGPQLASLLTQNSNARVYVCGDVENMMKQIFSIFVEILEKHAGDKLIRPFYRAAMTKIDATHFLVKMQADKRYILDYWI
ncbi:methionine synthase reductase [Trichuris trichiura]|uniref:Methionine synthase reductase n=1 Tax=Trichuris trichiura TaxID=36087 RepID=A0A077Z601_TRITR|nr:methionine synthase reductase [Trichuris trichiura]